MSLYSNKLDSEDVFDSARDTESETLRRFYSSRYQSSIKISLACVEPHAQYALDVSRGLLHIVVYIYHKRGSGGRILWSNQ